MKLIASICPWPARIERPLFTPQTIFEIGACVKGEAPATLEIHSQTQYERLLSNLPPMPHSILDSQIADDFILHTTLNGPFMTAEAHPGIWICRGDQPAQDEIEETAELHTRYCHLVIEEADEWYTRRMAGEPRIPKHTQRHKDCANWLLLEKPWLSNFKPDTYKQCPFCKVSVLATAVKCTNCGEVINKEGYAELKKQFSNAGQFQPKTATQSALVQS